jgi:dCTP deaminase
MPNAQFRTCVDILLINQRHKKTICETVNPKKITFTNKRINHRTMILSDKRILEEMEKGTIKVVPYDRECLGSNSYDVHLGPSLATYEHAELDAKKHNTIVHFDIPEDGILLLPHMFYLGVTQEYTETHAHVPFLEGKSSTGRLGIDIHATAGKGDVGFCGNWTLEISVKQPVRVYKGMPIGQLIYFPVDGEIEVKYNQKKNAKYSGQPNKPVESMMWKNEF